MKLFINSVILIFVFAPAGFTYSEFQRYSKEASGRPINCAMCHLHSDGPEGLKPGQIGSLSQEQLNALGLARQAFKPGAQIKSPILNEFGNQLLNDLGREKIIALKQNPGLLAQAMSKTSDLDGDGITDAEEFLDGTNPLNSLDGHPWKLLKNNLKKNWFHVGMIALATFLGMVGFQNLLLYISIKARK